MYPILKFLTVPSANLWEKILAWYQESFLRELLLALDDGLFSVELGVYENLTVSDKLPTTARNVILGLTLGTVIAAALMLYTKTVHGKFIRALLSRGCNSPENAATLMELGMFRSDSVRRDLARGGALTKLALCVQREALLAAKSGENEGEDAEKRDTYLDFRPDFTVARYYIPEELRYRAEFRYSKKGMSVWLFLLTVAFCFVGAALLCSLLPTLLGLADWLIGALAP